MLELNALQHAHQKMASQRQRTGLNFIELAYENLARSEVSGFEDKEALKAAVDFFIKALKYTPGVEGFVGLSYVYLLLGNTPMAKRYLTMAQDKAPQDPDVLALRAYAENPMVVEEEDPDAAMDTLEALIFAQEKQLRHWPLPHLDQALPNAKDHAERTLMLSENLRLIRTKLDELKEDDADLLHRIRHLDDTHQKYQVCQENITRIQELGRVDKV